MCIRDSSSSIPVLYEPIHIGNHWYADGGLLMNLPVSPIRDLASYIIAVNLIPRKVLAFDEVNTIAGVAARTFNLAAINTCLLYTSDAADERSSVDLGGRRIIKKKKQ